MPTNTRRLCYYVAVSLSLYAVQFVVCCSELFGRCVQNLKAALVVGQYEISIAEPKVVPLLPSTICSTTFKRLAWMPPQKLVLCDPRSKLVPSKLPAGTVFSARKQNADQYQHLQCTDWELSCYAPWSM
eukprot:2461848-Rhodomonas_salina.1